MLALTEEQLEQPEAIAPYVSFRDLVTPLVEGQELPRPARILDIGAGAGAYGELLERWWPGRFDYVGADYSAEILAVARERWPGRRFVQLDVLEAGALDGFDVVMASALLDVLAEVEPGLDALLASDARWLVLHRQRIDPRRTHVEVASGYRGQHTYRSYVTRAQLDESAALHGRRVCGEVVVDGDVHSFLLARTLITIFSIPKAFSGEIDVIQRNAVRSWRALGPDVQVILLGDEEGVSRGGERARRRARRRTSHATSTARRGSTTPLHASTRSLATGSVAS